MVIDIFEMIWFYYLTRFITVVTTPPVKSRANSNQLSEFKRCTIIGRQEARISFPAIGNATTLLKYW